MLTELQIAIFSGLSGMLCWGLADFLTKKSIDKIGNLKTLLWSQLIGAIPIIIYLFFNFQIPQLNLQILFPVLLFGVFVVLVYLLLFQGFNKGKVSVISPIYSCYAAVSILVSWIIFHEAILQLTWIGLGIIFFGIILAAFNYQDFKEVDFEIKNLGKGVPETLLAMLIFGFWLPLWDKFLENKNWIFYVLLVRIVIVLTTFIIYSIKKPNKKIEDKKIWTWLILIGLFDSIASIFLAWGLSSTKLTSIVTILVAAAPIPTIILARIFLKEKLSLTQKIGVILVLIGLIIISI